MQATAEPTLSDVLQELRTIKSEVEKLGSDVENLRDNVEKLGSDVEKLRDNVEKLDYKIDVFQKGSDGMVRMATTIIIAAGTVTILSPFVQSVAPAVRAVLGGNAAG